MKPARCDEQGNKKTKEASDALHEPATIWRNERKPRLDRGLANAKSSLIWTDINSNERASMSLQEAATR